MAESTHSLRWTPRPDTGRAPASVDRRARVWSRERESVRVALDLKSRTLASARAFARNSAAVILRWTDGMVPNSACSVLRWRVYSWAGICCSDSYHALIFKRRQTQQRCSAEFEAHSAPQTTHFPLGGSLSGCASRFAWARISLEITGSVGGIRFFRIGISTVHPISAQPGRAPQSLSGTQAAVSYLTTDAGSREEEQRGHFWPGLVAILFPETTTCASTMCVQIGQ